MKKYWPVAVILAFIFVGLVFWMSRAHGASLNVPLPDGCVPVLTAYTVGCASGPTPPTPPTPTPTPTPPPTAGPGCAGFQANPVEIAWPAGGNINQPLPFFGPSTALVVHFKTPNTIDSALFTLGNTSGGASNTNVRMSISAAAGCNTPSTLPLPPGSPVMWVNVSQTPALALCVGAPKLGCKVQLQLNTDYWVTIVNRDNFPGVNTCHIPNCGINRRFDFNS